jgi:hypothetical protein
MQWLEREIKLDSFVDLKNVILAAFIACSFHQFCLAAENFCSDYS